MDIVMTYLPETEFNHIYMVYKYHENTMKILSSVFSFQYIGTQLIFCIISPPLRGCCFGFANSPNPIS